VRQDENEFIVRCGCGDLSHLVHLSFWKEDDELIIGLKIEDASLGQRIKNAILYILKQRKFWHYGETLVFLNRAEELKEIKDLRAFLNRIIKQVEKKS
jgi:hypothetical protein